jgi:hypothetical protein
VGYGEDDPYSGNAAMISSDGDFWTRGADEDEDDGEAARAVLAFVVVLAEYVADLFRWNDALKNRGTAAVAEVKRLV